jgi:hypothetical protein
VVTVYASAVRFTRVTIGWRALALLSAAWFVALVATVARALATRSELAGTQDSAGPMIVVLVMPLMIASGALLRHAVIAVVTLVAACVVSCALASSVLHDQSSTAAIGVAAVPVWTAAAVVIGVVIDRSLRRRTPPSPP